MLFEYVVDELTHRTSIIHDKLDDSTTGHISISVHARVFVKNRDSTIEYIKVHRITCSAVNVRRTLSEDGLEELVEHSELSDVYNIRD